MQLASIVPANLKGTLHWLKTRTHWQSIEAITYSLEVMKNCAYCERNYFQRIHVITG